MEARAEQHRDFVRQMACEQFFHPAHHQFGLAHVAEGRDQPHGVAAHLARKKILAKRFRSVGQQIVGHVEHGFGGAVVFLQPHNPRTGKQRGKIQNIADIGPTKGVDGLGFVTHGHDVAGRALFRPCQQAHNAGLHQVCILIFVHKNMAETLAQRGRSQLVVAQ